MKNDLQLQSDVEAELAWDPGVNASGIAVSVSEGVVRLSGVVDTCLQKRAAEGAVHRVSGARGLATELQVRLPPGLQRSDEEIAKAALHALDWHSLVPEDSVKVRVENGWVTLTGEVDWSYQSASAEQCIHPLLGVRGVSNAIRLRRRADPEQLRDEIAAAFARRAQRDATHVTIAVDGSVVTLSGRVSSLAEHDAAIGTAFGARGVTRVVDHLRVG
ncbi:BON domain-containing protein [Ramlibacter monticola]|uniref:BON domain-containing protein n=1 Tax=Ramlibacter monticola TaxID=1926872 RepID=A0A937CTK1_9BURK|nr:BON domain-containing protein [Ramlibacter monticola]MBL0391157.1 BON domain-containing protein [Ramlibacter monticola]